MKPPMKPLLALMALLVAACGPMYHTQTQYAPPADAEGRNCIARCEIGKSQCRSTADLRAENSQLRCERDARDDYERCLGNAKGDAGRNSCTRRSCTTSPDYAACGADYDVCFQSCGGVVSTQQVCTFNCP